MQPGQCGASAATDTLTPPPFIERRYFCPHEITSLNIWLGFVFVLNMNGFIKFVVEINIRFKSNK